MNSEQSRAKLTHWVLIAGLVSLLPLLVEQVGKLWLLPHWRFFPLAWGIFALCIVMSPKVGIAASPTRRLFAVVLSAVGVGIGILATLTWSPSFGQLAAILLLSGWALLILAVVPWTRVIAFTTFLWITWPPPGGFVPRLLSIIHNRALSTGSNILDLFGTTHFLSGSKLDLRFQQLDLASLIGSYDSVYTLLFLAVIVVVGLHCSLFMSLLILASVPVISWMGTVTQFLIHVWVAESLASNWLEGWPLIGLRTGIFLSECGLFWSVFVGVHNLFEPIFSDSPEQVNRHIQNAYNQLVIWPVRLTATAGAETRAYFEEEQVVHSPEQMSSPVRVIRPSVAAAKLASDPWQWTRGTYGLMSVCAASLVIGVLTYLVPPREVKPLPEYSESQLASIAKFKEFPESSIDAQLVGTRVAEFNPDTAWREIDWDFFSNKGAISFSLTLPHYRFQPFVASQQWALHQNRKLFKESDWPVYEVEYVNEFGRITYVWYTGFDKRSGPAASETTLLGNVFSRIENSLLGRLFPTGETPLLFMTTLLLESNEPISLGSKKTHRAACVAYTKAVAERTMSVQP